MLSPYLSVHVVGQYGKCVLQLPADVGLLHAKQYRQLRLGRVGAQPDEQEEEAVMAA